jgi:anti-anti-sigma factor
MSADWHSHRDGGTVTITLSGELDVANVEVLEASTDGLLDAVEIVLDLRAVTFLDSVVLGRLVRLHQDAEAAGATMRLVVDDASMTRTLLRITGLDQVFPVSAAA